MKKKTLTILIVVLGLTLCSAKAGPIGTAFTYQGRLIDDGKTAYGLYDFEFQLYDANSDGNKMGTDVDIADVNVIDGYFTVELDFGAEAFDGQARWLEISVRPGESEDPYEYIVLSPRQEVTSTPYAIRAANAGSDNDWEVDGNDMYSIPSGNVGIGTTNLGAKLTVSADSGSPLFLNYNLMDAVGMLAFHRSGNLKVSHILESNNDYGIWVNGDRRLTITNAGNVGIGTTSPQASQNNRAIKLDVNGNIVAEDVYLDNPKSGSPRWASEAAVGTINSNVVFSFSSGFGNRTWHHVSGFPTTILKTKFKKIAGISTVTIYCSIWQDGGSSHHAICQVSIGGASGSVQGTGGQTTPEWNSFDIDVSGLTNGTVYDVTIQLSNDDGYDATCDSIIGIAS